MSLCCRLETKLNNQVTGLLQVFRDEKRAHFTVRPYKGDNQIEVEKVTTVSSRNGVSCPKNRILHGNKTCTTFLLLDTSGLNLYHLNYLQTKQG